MLVALRRVGCVRCKRGFKLNDVQNTLKQGGSFFKIQDSLEFIITLFHKTIIFASSKKKTSQKLQPLHFRRDNASQIIFWHFPQTFLKINLICSIVIGAFAYLQQINLKNVQRKVWFLVLNY